MKNPAQVLDQINKIRIPDWIFEEVEDDDFLMGKRPKDLGDIWEEEE